MSVILNVQEVKTHFQVSGGLFSRPQIVRAVDGVSFSINVGETYGLVGESGCGKSTLGRTIMRIYDPDEGSIEFEGVDIATLKGPALKAMRRRMQMIFQDPYASLDPRMTVGEIIREPMDIHSLYSPAEREARVSDLLRVVGLKPDHIRRYPHEFSGGQRQRIGIARTLVLDPAFIVCDEPVSALDISIQAQIINLLEQIQQERGISYLFIAHDLSMVKHISQRIGVMYLGHIVESGPSDILYHHPLHPYTKALLSAVPIPDPRIAKSRSRVVLEGELPSPINPPSGCTFRTRCPQAMNICAAESPSSICVEGRDVACHLYR